MTWSSRKWTELASMYDYSIKNFRSEAGSNAFLIKYRSPAISILSKPQVSISSPSRVHGVCVLPVSPSVFLNKPPAKGTEKELVCVSSD